MQRGINKQRKEERQNVARDFQKLEKHCLFVLFFF